MQQAAVVHEHGFPRRQQNRLRQPAVHDLVLTEVREATRHFDHFGRVPGGDAGAAPVERRDSLVVVEDRGDAALLALLEEHLRLQELLEQPGVENRQVVEHFGPVGDYCRAAEPRLLHTVEEEDVEFDVGVRSVDVKWHPGVAIAVQRLVDRGGVVPDVQPAGGFQRSGPRVFVLEVEIAEPRSQSVIEGPVVDLFGNTGDPDDFRAAQCRGYVLGALFRAPVPHRGVEVGERLHGPVRSHGVSCPRRVGRQPSVIWTRWISRRRPG